MKIAFPTEDGKTISAHFGRAPYFVVAALGENGETSYEQRSKDYHGAHEEHEHHAQSEQAHQVTHNSMFGVIADCQVLIGGGMGEPALRHAENAGLKVVLTGEKDIQSALKAYLDGSLVSDPRRIHVHK